MAEKHPPKELLLDYCTGSLTEGASLAIETHISMCDECSHEEARLMSVGAAFMEQIEAASMQPGSLNTVFERIDQLAASDRNSLIRSKRATPADLPHPLMRYLPNGLAACKWKKVGPWFEETRLKVSSSTKVSLMRLKAGSLMPRHTHRGNEMTVVLAGGYSDNGVSYGPGDFSLKDGDDHHQPRVDDDGVCLCLVVLDAPVRLTGGVEELKRLLIRP